MGKKKNTRKLKIIDIYGDPVRLQPEGPSLVQGDLPQQGEKFFTVKDICTPQDVSTHRQEMFDSTGQGKERALFAGNPILLLKDTASVSSDNGGRDGRRFGVSGIERRKLAEPVPFSPGPITAGVRSLLASPGAFSRQVPTAAGGPLMGPGHPEYGIRKLARSPYLYGEPSIPETIEDGIVMSEKEFKQFPILMNFIRVCGIMRVVLNTTPRELFTESLASFNKKINKLYISDAKTIGTLKGKEAVSLLTAIQNAVAVPKSKRKGKRK